MKKGIILILFVALLLAFTVSCGTPDIVMGGADLIGPGQDASDGTYNEGLLDKEYSDSNSSTSVAPDRKIIKTVTETVETENYDGFIDSLYSSVTAFGGYISSSRFSGGGIYNKEENRYAYFEIRIPAERLSEFTGAVDGLGAVTYYQESVNDVTLSYVDISSKISVLEAEETALLEILAGATTTADIITIRNSLTDVQSELASLRSQKNALDSKIAYSTVSLTLKEVARLTEASPDFFTEVGDRFSDSLDAIGGACRAFAVWLIGDALYILMVAAIGIGIFFLVRYIIRRYDHPRVEKKSENEADTAEKED